MTIGAVVLAAGASRRLGRAKQLVVHRGETLIRTTVRMASASRSTSVCVVLGASAFEIMPAVLGMNAEVVHNPAWESGMASSIQCGVAWGQRHGHEAIVICACDQPHLTSAHLDALISAYRATGRVVASRYANVRGVPAVFPRASFPALEALVGDRGARQVLATCDPYEVRWDRGAIDVDTPRDLLDLRVQP